MAALAMGMVAGYYTEQVFGFGSTNTISKGEAKKCKSCANYPCPKSKKPMQIVLRRIRKKEKEIVIKTLQI